MTVPSTAEVEESVAAPHQSAPPLALYAMTGFTGLLAEQGLEKYTTLLVGATAAASAAVIFTYFLGFALGGFATARLLGKGAFRKPLRAYAGLELLVGVSCIGFSYVFHPLMRYLAPLQNLVDGQAGKLVVRFGCACLLVLPIAALMGASFPLIAQALDNRDESGPRKWAAAYGANLSGAVLASLAAPYFLIPEIGIRGVMWMCFAICAVVACAVQWRGESAPSPASAGEARVDESPAEKHWLLLCAAFLSGWIFFALEVIWTHLIGAVIGGSVYAFSAMLASVLGGLLIGSAVVSRGRVIRTSMLLQLCAIAVLIQFWVWDLAPVMFVIAGPFIYAHFFTREAYRLLVSAILIVPPAAVLGMIYPRLLTAAPKDRNASLAGYLSASNSLGCLIGALMATFLLIPMLGSEISLKLIVLLLGSLALMFRMRETDRGSSPKAVAVMALVMLAVAVLPRHWEWQALTSGQAMYFGEARTAAPAQEASTSSIIFKDESLQGGFTTVLETKTSSRTVRYLLANGKLQGDNDASGQVATQFGVAAIPCMFAGGLDRALLIGLGTGHTAGVLKELGVGELDIAELSPGIIRAADADFQDVNYNVLHDPSVRYGLEDGRNLLLTNPQRRYDIITVEITSIWFAGATSVFSKEFFELARERLQPDGVLQQWVQLNRNSPTEIDSVIATARDVFPYVSYYAYGGQGMLVAANRPIALSDARKRLLLARFSPRYGAEGASRLVEDLARSQILSSTHADALIAALRPVINTDHNRFIEYSTPARVSSERDWVAYNLAYFARWNR